MSKCMTCKYALYDGMCLAQGKFTLLDAQACDDYKPRIDFEASQLKAENAKLRELVRDYERCSVHADCGLCEYDGKLSTHCPLSPCFPDADELCELRIEVDE